MSRSPLDLDRLAFARAPQRRADGAVLEVYDDDGSLGRFVDSGPATWLHGVDGAPLLAVHLADGATRARIDAAAGTAGFVSRIGRVRVNLQLYGPHREPLGQLRPLGDGSGWVGDSAVLRAWRIGPPTVDAYGEARYALEVDGAEPAVRPLLAGLAAFVDRAVVQALSPPA